MSARNPYGEAIKALREFERKDLGVLLTHIAGSHAALRRDANGDPAIIGTRGLIHACNGLFTAHITARSRRHWTYVRKSLTDLCTITADHRDGGALRLDRLPEGTDADELRHAIGLRCTRPASQADRLKRATSTNVAVGGAP
jgi:hypothetical protein